jgi:hypothetical protein
MMPPNTAPYLMLLPRHTWRSTVLSFNAEAPTNLAPVKYSSTSTHRASSSSWLAQSHQEKCKPRRLLRLLGAETLWLIQDAISNNNRTGLALRLFPSASTLRLFLTLASEALPPQTRRLRRYLLHHPALRSLARAGHLLSRQLPWDPPCPALERLSARARLPLPSASPITSHCRRHLPPA